MTLNPTLFSCDIYFRVDQAVDLLEEYYLNDGRSFCVAYSGGKDSTAVIHLVFEMLKRVKSKNKPLSKPVYIVNSNTLAELPPMLKHLKKSLKSIEDFSKQCDFPVHVKEVVPDTKKTLNVQFFGVGMPPPSPSFRWCTEKLM